MNPPLKNARLSAAAHHVANLLGGTVMGGFSATFAESELVGNAFGVSEDFGITHYLPVEHFISLLTSGRMYLRRLDLYSDSDDREGLYPAENEGAVSPIDMQIGGGLETAAGSEGFRRAHEKQREYSYIHCWFGSDRRNSAMWEKYGRGGTGVCLVSSSLRLREAVVPPSPFVRELGRITYHMNGKPLPVAFGLLPMMSKKAGLSDENEVRLLTYYARAEDWPTNSDGSFAPAPDHLLIPVDISRFVSAIIIGPKMDPLKEMEIIEMCGKMNLTALIQREGNL